jgi:acetyltransferase-like isoleucine patch superfamily enzyme
MNVCGVARRPTNSAHVRGHGTSVPPVFDRPDVPAAPWVRVVGTAKSAVGELIHRVWSTATAWATIGPDTARGRRFGAFGRGSAICFPPTTIMNERYVHIGAGTIIGPHVALSAGMVPGQVCITDPVVRIGDRCLIGRGSGIVGHLQIEIGDDVWTGHHVYITDQNHGYDDPDLPISRQVQPERPVVIGDGSWIGHGTVVLPGARIGRHVVIGANSVVTGEIPDYSIAVGAPARVVKRIVSE